MPYEAYREVNFRGKSLEIIEQADNICRSYAKQGYTLTLRQLYYQFVSRGLIANKDTEYKRLGSIVNDARLSGMLDWNHIVDRTRVIRQLPHWGSPTQTADENAAAFVEAVMPQFRIERWSTQPVRIEVWIEKEALVDVVARPSDALDIAYFACRGYNSQSNAWRAAKRVEGYYDEGAERVLILHLGDHDPSGIDMSRDIEERFRDFLALDGYPQGRDRTLFEVRRIALNMDQVRRFNPPPNPAKLTDSRIGNYLAMYGPTSWELDALDPPTIDALIRTNVRDELNDDLWSDAIENEQEAAHQLSLASKRWSDVVEFLTNEGDN